MLSYGTRRVALADVDEANLERETARLSAAHPGTVLGIHCDVTKEDDVQGIIQRAAQFGGGRSICCSTTPAPGSAGTSTGKATRTGRRRSR